MDDALRAYEAGRWADALKASKQVQQSSADGAVRQQAAYVAGCAAQELGRTDEARGSFAIAAKSSDPVVAGRALVMQGNMAVEERRWADAESAYSAAASKLRGRDAELAREQARDAAAQVAASRKAAAAGVPAVPAPKPAVPAPTPLPEPESDAPWTVSAGVFSTETAARTRATNLAKIVKAAGLPTPRVLAVSSPGKRVWIVEVGSFDDRAKAEAARKKVTVGDAQVVRSRVPQPPK